MLKKQTIIQDFILPEIQRLGFTDVLLNEPYCPLRLKCYVRNNDSGRVSVEKINSSESSNMNYFFPDCAYKLYFMFGKDKNGKISLFCKDKPEDELCRVVEGEFGFYFNAKMFFHLLRFAEPSIWSAFIRNIIVENYNEIEEFAELLYNSHDLFEEQQVTGALFIDKFR